MNNIIYIKNGTVVLPDKMKYNLAAIRSFSFIDDIKVMILTVLAVFR